VTQLPISILKLSSIATKVKHRLKRIIIPLTPIDRSRDQWEAQYSSGYWEFLRSYDELPRYSIIVGYCQKLGDGLSILDIGCGEGILAEKMGPHMCANYVGIDISDKAIKIARKHGYPASEFQAIDATKFVPDFAFDVIVFNEIVCYLPDPVTEINRYRESLNPDGILVVSMHQTDGNAERCVP